MREETVLFGTYEELEEWFENNSPDTSSFEEHLKNKTGHSFSITWIKCTTDFLGNKRFSPETIYMCIEDR